MSTDPATEGIPLEWTFGDRLRKIRRAAGLSQEEFARTIGATPQAVGAWELDTSTPRNIVEVAKRIEAAFGTRATYILGLEQGGIVYPPESGGGGGGGGGDMKGIAGLTTRHARTGVQGARPSQLHLVAA